MKHKIMSIKNIKDTISIILFLILGIFLPAIVAVIIANYVALQNGYESGTYAAGILRLFLTAILIGIAALIMKKLNYLNKG